MVANTGQLADDVPPGTAVGGISLRLIGGMAVSHDGEELVLPRSKKPQALLAYLAVTGRSHQREQLCRIFWHLPDDPRGALRWSLSKLRGLVDLDKDHPHINADRNSVAFDCKDVAIDTNEVRRQTRAGLEGLSSDTLASLAAQLAEVFLDGLDQPDLLDFQAWLIAEREELLKLRIQVLKALITRLDDDPEAAMPHARALVGADPDNEIAHVLLVATLAGAGRRGEAEQQAQLAVAQLERAGIPASGALDGAIFRLRHPSGSLAPTPKLETPAASAATPPPQASPTRSDRPSIAVLPLECMSAERKLEFMTDGLSEDLITLLARIPGFFVISRSSVFAYKGQRPDIRQVGADLGVRYLVEGSLRPVAGKLRVTIQLFDVETDSHLWADRFDQDAERMDELQDQITSAIIARLEPELTRAEFARVQRRPPKNLDAWGYYQQAHGLLAVKGWRGETFAEALKLLGRAIEMEPEFAIAHAYRSLLLAVGHMFHMTPDIDDAAEAATEEAEVAMRIDNNDPTVLGYVGCALCDLGQPRRGLELLQRAVEHDPSNAQAWVALGTGLLGLGRAKEGIGRLEYGISISPLDQRLAYWETILAYALFRTKRAADALEVARRACRRDDKFQISRVVLAIILAAGGDQAAAAGAIEEARRIDPEFEAEHMRGLIGRRGIQILRQAQLLS